MKERLKSAEILLVEDNPGDIRLMVEALKENTVLNKLSVVNDGSEALAFMHRKGKYAYAPRPDIILLDLNLPKKDGKEVLAEIKNDPDLKMIPVVVLTASSAEQDIFESYNLNANCYVTKPIDFGQFRETMKCMMNFWFTIVKLPPGE